MIMFAQKAVHLFVFDTLADWEYAFAAVGIHNSAFQKQPGQFRIETVALNKTPVKTMGGVTIVPDTTLDAIRPTDSAMLILPGGMAWEKGENLDAVEKAKEWLDAGVPVAAICGATAALARAGVLDVRRHTSNSLGYLKATGYRGESLYAEELAVTDQNVITAGGMSPLEFAYQIFKRLDVFSPEKLDAWYALFKNSDVSQYEVLAR
jgi:putative intracellular protease/amidase